MRNRLTRRFYQCLIPTFPHGFTHFSTDSHMPTTDFEKKAKAIRAFLRDHGMTVREFAESKGLDRQDVADLLYLRNKGVRGKAHQAAVAIGLKPKPRRKSVEEYA